MTRKLASLVDIDTVAPVENSDRLDVVTMKGKGWRVVTGRGNFRPGESAVYFEIDSALPADDPRYSFLRERCLRRFMTKDGRTCLKECLRIRTVKLRGVISQGLLVPTTKLSAGELLAAGADGDLTDVLHVEHFDEISAALSPQRGVQAFAGGTPFPTGFIPKTDEERIQNLTDYFTVMKDRIFEVTEKNDGSSMTVFYSKDIDPEHPFGVCSRNFRLNEDDTSVMWNTAKSLDLEAKLSKHPGYAFQGELVGPGINGNRDLYPKHEWHVFRVWDIGEQHFLNPLAARAVCAELGLQYVPVIEDMLPVFKIYTTTDDLLRYAEGTTARGHQREGLVFKSTDDGPYVSFKAVSNAYLLKQE